MEIYLSHMVMFRVIEKLHLNTVLGNGWIQYLLTVLLVFVSATCFSFVAKKEIELVNKRLVKM